MGVNIGGPDQKPLTGVDPWPRRIEPKPESAPPLAPGEQSNTDPGLSPPSLPDPNQAPFTIRR